VHQCVQHANQEDPLLVVDIIPVEPKER
jgi:hypothetical protein